MSDLGVEVLDQLEESFGSLVYPGDEQIVYDNSGHHLECVDVKQTFLGKHWRELSLDTLVYENSALSFFTPLAFQFYLPAYLSAVVKNYDQADVLPSDVVFYLTVPSEADTLTQINALQRYATSFDFDLRTFLLEQLSNSNQRVQRFIERVSIFDKKQGRVIKNFLLYMQLEHADDFPSQEPQTAIERYWFMF
ncbi:DUF6714 family protein [Anthocerotibacter panamensis]|uniref:DUF6714 family protein n=1 Tax=Anthocerotibacter panamensis TaxID=2857077 RepID=UPI001C402E12|nr:DUF6714 family protein [Anthocerotibacter panamensis]